MAQTVEIPRKLHAKQVRFTRTYSPHWIDFNETVESLGKINKEERALALQIVRRVFVNRQPIVVLGMPPGPPGPGPGPGPYVPPQLYADVMKLIKAGELGPYKISCTNNLTMPIQVSGEYTMWTGTIVTEVSQYPNGIAVGQKGGVSYGPCFDVRKLTISVLDAADLSIVLDIFDVMTYTGSTDLGVWHSCDFDFSVGG